MAETIGRTGMRREELEGVCADLAREVIVPILPAGAGFALLLFDLGERGNMAYMSNAKREDMINALEDLIGILKPN
ncbi:MAG: hypothetical protein KJO40_18240 [Deltaproteobacteria bacterium]|nr:hypothetical protein [Deltaproteobacteria bacterium]